MVSYNSSNVIQCLRQYEMFANSLNLVKNRDERDMVVRQLTKLEGKILELTNEIYEEEYYALANKECGLLDEEKKRVSMLIDLINQRLSYVEKRCNDHYQLTGQTLDIKDVMGANTLDSLEDRVKIIDKYSKNVAQEKELKEEVKSLTSKIALASEKIEINKSLNIELEAKFKDLLSSAFEKLGLYELLDDKENLEYAYYETEKSLTLAELNLEAAKTSPINVLNDCQIMLDEVKLDYIKYKDKLSTLKLMEMFNREVDNYDELINKRKEVNDLFKHIKNQELIDMVMDTISKQYNTILMEKQDVNTFNDLVLEKERKLEALAEIEDENNSERFKSVLRVLIENEKKKQEKLLEEQRKIEEEEKKRRLEIERKKQEEILKRQKIIEEARKKEIEKRTKKLLEQQQNSVLQSRKKENTVSFETIKDITQNDEDSEVVQTQDKNENEFVPMSRSSLKLDEMLKTGEVLEREEPVLFKDKNDIEKELFEEFNSIDVERNEEVVEELKEEKNIDDNRFPDMSIDEYMKNFNEKEINIEDTNGLFDDDIFPTIPI